LKTASPTATASRHWTLFIVIVAVLFVADQVTKFMALDALTHAFDTYGEGALSLGEQLGRFMTLKHPGTARVIAVIPDFWHFRYAENPGAAFSFLGTAGSSLRTPFLLLVAVVAMVFIVVYYRRTGDKQGLLRVALAMVFAGALGNFVDRARFGYVIDFIDWHWLDKATWPTFNVADSAISVGVALLVLDMLSAPKPKEAGAGTPAKAKGG